MPPKILLVDDVTMFLELQKDFLKCSSVHTITANNGEEALQICQKERPALVFMDLHMPVMNGTDCCKALKADPLLKMIPVIMITSEGKEADKLLCFSSGCNDFLTKPLDRKIFLDKARSYLPDIDRRQPRAFCQTKVKFKTYGVTLSGEVLDISINGIYVKTDYEVEAGVIMELVFALPDEDGAIIQAKGKVAWTNNKLARGKVSLPDGFGIEFISLTTESHEALIRYVGRKAFTIIKKQFTLDMS